MKGKPLNIRLFLEGIEIPVVSAVITSLPNAPLQASIQIPPIAEAKDIIERTLVHLFYYDPGEGDITIRDAYKLMFLGEVVGIRGVKHAVNYAIVLTCLGNSVYWDTTYLFNSTGLGKKGRRLASFVGANTSVVSSTGASSIFPDGDATGYSKLAKIINQRPASFPKMKGMLGGIVHLLERVGGFYRGEKVYKGFNDFTSLAELRLKMMQQIHAASKDNSSALLFKRPTLRKWVKNTIASRGSMESFNIIAKKLMQLIYHQRQSIPAPPYFPGKEEKKQKKVWVSKGHEATAAVGKIRQDLNDLTQNEITSRNNWERVLRKGKGVLSRATRICNEQLVASENRGNKTHASRFARAYRVFRESRNLVRDTIRIYRRQVSKGEVTDESLVAGTRLRYGDALDKARSALRILSGIRRTGSYKSKTYTETQYERLGIHVFKPDLFFAAPPMCNVIFPDMYDHFEWNRNFLAEPTRLMLRGGSKRSGDIFGGGYSKYGVYFAPDNASVRNSVKLSSTKFATQIMDHELYSGIIPAQIQIPWSKVYKIDIKGSEKKYTYMQRLANFEYAKRHFAARAATVTGSFNPYFLPGFPALVIDQRLAWWQVALYELPLSESSLSLEIKSDKNFKNKAELLDELVPPQYLGFCQQLVHSISQRGGVTTYSLTMVRDHREAATKLGFGATETLTRYRSKTKTSLVLLYPGAHDITDIRLGPRGNKVISQKRSGDPRPGRTYWLPETAGEWRAPITRWSRYTWSSDDAEVYARQGIVPPTVYLLYEQESVVKKKTTKDLGIEFAITPPWMARCWHLGEIGNTYDEMFGCGSIADAVGAFASDELASAYRQDRSIRDRTQKELSANSLDDTQEVSNKEVDTLDYSGFDTSG